MSEQPTGIFTMPAEDYHADPCLEPSLSASIAHLMVSRSPWHAWTAHPRLNPSAKRREESRFDIGTAAHALLLEQRPLADVVVAVEAKDWKTKAAQEQRDEARAAGLVPLLTSQAVAVVEMIEATMAQLKLVEAEPAFLEDGKAEQTLIWQENGTTCRALVDWLRDDCTAIDDYKTTPGSAHPNAWTRTMFNIGADIQTVFHVRGVEKITGIKPELRYIVQETYPPYALSIVSAGPDVLAVAENKVEWALKTWARCLESSSWPAYPRQVCYADLPPWLDVPMSGEEE